MNISGDLLTSGNIVNPILNAVILDSGAINSGALNNCYFDLNITLQCTVAATFEIGVFNNDDTADKTFRYTVVANDSKLISFQKVPVKDGQKLKIRAGLAIIGTANVAINLTSNGQD